MVAFFLEEKMEIEMGPGPCEEPLARRGDADYDIRAEIEARVWLRQLRRSLRAPAARLTVRTTRDGAREVRLITNDGDAAPIDIPTRWDSIALAELRWFRQQYYYSGLVGTGRIAPHDVPAQFKTVLPPTEVAQEARHETEAA